MEKNKSIYIGLGMVSVFIVLFVFTFRPIMNPKPNQCTIITGTVEQIWSSDETHDINIRLEGVDKTYYINRGLDSGLRTYNLKDLIGEHIQIYAVKHWTLLDPKQKIRHVACVITSRDTLYTEF